MAEEALYRLALTRVMGIGAVHTKKLIHIFGDAQAVFRASKKALSQAALGEDSIGSIMGFRGQAALEAEMQQLERAGIRQLFFADEDYPRRLLSVSDAPPLLFYRGKADLNAKKIISVVGTRLAGDYGAQMTARLIRQLAQPGLLIVSGLAVGIDAKAHAAAMDNHLPTVAVLGHGHGTIYPREHSGLSAQILETGGLLTAFGYAVGPERYNFPVRNRWIAALCDALVVVETRQEGGSMLTVADALRYGKKIFAVPGRITDQRSMGCNKLIAQGHAQMLCSGEELSAAMGWGWPAGRKTLQGSLSFSGPQPDEMPSGASSAERLTSLLASTESLSIDECTARLMAEGGLSSGAAALLLLDLEIKGVVSRLPGQRYRSNTVQERV
jgi:DNA processing protein